MNSLIFYTLQFIIIMVLLHFLLFFELKINAKLFYDLYYSVISFDIKHRKLKNKNNNIWFTKLKKQYLNNCSIEDLEDLCLFLLKELKNREEGKKK